jgi:transcriptional regulator with XRE-family HTH domain
MKRETLSFGARLRELRERAGLSLRQLESETGISNGYLSQIESGRVGAPSPKILEKLAKALRYPYVELMQHAGHLSTDAPLEPILRLGGREHSLSELTDAERREVVRFVEELKSKRIGRKE